MISSEKNVVLEKDEIHLTVLRERRLIYLIRSALKI